MNASNSASRCTHESGNKRVWRGNGSTLDEITFWSVNGQKLATYKPVNLGGSSVYFSLTGTDVYFGSRLIAKGTPNGGTNADYVTLASVATDRLGSIGKFYPFGQERPSATANDTEKFTGYYRDAATGLDYADQRYHQPGVGRFTSPDPYQASGGVGAPGSWNRYASVAGDPINHVDPNGLAACDPDDPTCESMCSLCDDPDPTGTGGIVCGGGGVVLSMMSATDIICSQPVFYQDGGSTAPPPTITCDQALTASIQSFLQANDAALLTWDPTLASDLVSEGAAVNVDPRLMASIATLESGHGKSFSGNNPFGLGWKGSKSYTTQGNAIKAEGNTLKWLIGLGDTSVSALYSGQGMVVQKGKPWIVLQAPAYCYGGADGSGDAACQSAGVTVSGFLSSMPASQPAGLSAGNPNNLAYPCPQ